MLINHASIETIGYFQSTCWVKTTFLLDEQHLISYFLRTREGYKPTMTAIRRGLLPGPSPSSELDRDRRRQESSRDLRHS